MIIQVIGCSHHQSSVAIREQLAFTEQQIPPFLDSYHARFPDSEAVLLSTCNRTEFYSAAQKVDSLPDQNQLVEFLATERGLTFDEIQADVFAYRDRAAIEHLFTVAASLDTDFLRQNSRYLFIVTVRNQLRKLLVRSYSKSGIFRKSSKRINWLLKPNAQSL